MTNLNARFSTEELMQIRLHNARVDLMTQKMFNKPSTLRGCHRTSAKQLLKYQALQVRTGPHSCGGFTLMSLAPRMN